MLFPFFVKIKNFPYICAVQSIKINTHSKMNRYIMYISIALSCVMLGLTSCGDKDDSSSPEVSIGDPSPSSLALPASGGEQSVSIAISNAPANAYVLTSTSAQWLSANASFVSVQSSAAIYKVSVKAKPNTTLEPRSASVTVTFGGQDKSFEVTQAGADNLVLDYPDEVKADIPADGLAFTINVTSSADYQVTAPSWVTFSKSTDGKTISVQVSSNLLWNARSGKITVTCGSLSSAINLSQLAGKTQFDAALGPDWDSTDASSVAFSMGLGWNLGNQFDAYNNNVASETAWGNPKATQQLFDALKAAGINTVRIPVTWLGQFGAAPDYTITSAYINRIAEVVGYAENAGLKAILNIHHDGADSKHWLNIIDASASADKNKAIKAQITALWTQIANKFKDKGDFLIFESFNEIHDGKWGYGANTSDGGKQYKVLNEWNQLFVDVVRATGGNNATRYLGVPGYCTNPNLTIEHFVMPSDPANKTMVAVHFYDPNTFTLEATKTQWGHTADSKYKESWGDEDNICATFAKLKAKFVDNNIPVYIGEFGCVHHGDALAEQFRDYYLAYVARAARLNGFAAIIWDNGAKGKGREQSGMFDRTTGQYLNSDSQLAVEAIVNGYWSTDAVTLDDIYSMAPAR